MKTVHVLFVCMILLLQPGCSTGDNTSGHPPTAITGLVRDQSGAEIPGVRVELRRGGSEAPAETTLTNTAGEFAFAGIPEGKYQVTFALTGFKSVVREIAADVKKFSRVEVLLPLDETAFR